MKIIKGNKEYKGMFWWWVLWNSGSEVTFGYTIERLLPYNKKLKIIFKDVKDLRKYYYV